MKKFSLVFLLIIFMAGLVSANQLGVGYNNGGPTFRFKWDDAVTSELSVVVNYNNDSASSMSSTEILLSLAPVNLSLYRGELGEVNIGFVFRDRIIYRLEKGGDKTVIFTANDYNLDILLPELELSFPGIAGLKVISSLGVGTSWGYAENGKLDSFRMNLFGISMANVGLVYYFDLGTAPKAASTAVPAPVSTPAAKPAAVPASNAALEQPKDTPVK